MHNVWQIKKKPPEVKQKQNMGKMSMNVCVKQCVSVCVFLTVSSSDWLSPFRLLCRKAVELPLLEILIRASRAFCQHIHTQRKLHLSLPVLFHHKGLSFNLIPVERAVQIKVL